MPSPNAPKGASGVNVKRDTCAVNTVEDVFKQRYLQLNVEHIVGVGTAQERFDLHHKLTKDIADLYAVLLLWKRSVSASAPVSCLPPEVLQNVFQHLAALDPPITPRCKRNYAAIVEDDDAEDGAYGELWEPDSFEGFPTWNRHDEGSLGWMVVSHVWRSIVLPMRSLWAGAVGILPLATEELIKRAGTHPLSLTLRESSGRALRLHRPLSQIPHTSIRSLRASFTEDSEYYSSMRRLTGYIAERQTPWETLEYLDVLANGSPSLQYNKLMLNVPALIRAKMTNCVLPFFTARNLQNLSISFNMHRPGYNELPLPELLTFIDGCRDTLEELELFRCVDLDLENVPKSSAPAPVFSALRRLAVGAHSADLLRLVKGHIGYPESCHVAFHALYALKDERYYDNPMGLYTRANTPAAPHDAFHGVLRVFADELIERYASYGLVLTNDPHGPPSVSVCESTSVYINGGTDFFCELQNTGSHRVYFDPRNYETEYWRNMADALYAVDHSMQYREEDADTSAMKRAKTLSIPESIYKPPCAFTVAHFFERMVELEALQLYGYQQQTLKGLCDPSEGTKKKELVLPRLAVLRLSAGKKPLSCTELVQSLAMRAEAGKGKDLKPLSCLIVDKDVPLADPEMEDEAVGRLKELVDELVWRS